MIYLRKLILLVLLVPITVFASVPIQYVPNNNISTPDPQEWINIVQKNISLNPSQVASAKVQVIYDQKNKPDYLLVFLISAKDYSFTITKIKINEKNEVTGINSSYELTDRDFQQQPINSYEPECPDYSMEFVSATAFSDIPTAKAAVMNVFNQAQAYSYHAKMLLDSEATPESYLNWLSCPILKGFFNVGHGDNKSLILYDGQLLPYYKISKALKTSILRTSVVLFNSCNVFRLPLKNSLMEDALVQKYSGGITTLAIGPSEMTSQCLWNAGFQQQFLSKAIGYCNQHFDPRDLFGIGGHGADRLTLPDSRNHIN